MRKKALWFSSMPGVGGAAILTRCHAHQLLEHCREMGLMCEARLERNFYYGHIAVAQAVLRKLHARLPNEFSDRQSIIFAELPRDVHFVHSRFSRQLRKPRWIH